MKSTSPAQLRYSQHIVDAALWEHGFDIKSPRSFNRDAATGKLWNKEMMEFWRQAR